MKNKQSHLLISASPKTHVFFKSLIRKPQRQGFFNLKIKKFTFINGCFQIKRNAVFGVFGQRLITFIAFTIFASSCTSFQYITLDSDLPKSQHNDFFFENDTLQIVYSFNGHNCPVNIDIYNKLKTPLFIDWDKSAIVINGVSRSLKPDLSSIMGSMSGIALANETVSFSESNFNGLVKHSERLEFIAPESLLQFSTTANQGNFINVEQADSIGYRKLFTSELNYTKVKEHYYKRSNSPLNIRCYITYSDDTKANQSNTDSNFWVSKVYKSGSGTMEKRPDQYHIAKLTDFGSFMSVVGAAAIIVGVVAIKSNSSAELNH